MSLGWPLLTTAGFMSYLSERVGLAIRMITRVGFCSRPGDSGGKAPAVGPQSLVGRSWRLLRWLGFGWQAFVHFARSLLFPVVRKVYNIQAYRGVTVYREGRCK